MFGLFKTSLKSPIDGTIANISDVTGQIIISEPPVPIKVDSYIGGEIVAIIEDEGAAEIINISLGSLNELTPKDKTAMTYFAQVVLMQGYLQQNDEGFLRLENAIDNLEFNQWPNYWSF